MTLFEGFIAIAVVTIPSSISAASAFLMMRQGRQNKVDLEKKIGDNSAIASKTHDAVNSRMDELIKNMDDTFAVKIEALEARFATEKSEIRRQAKGRQRKR